MTTKINQILTDWPRGTLAHARWLGTKGVYPQLLQKYLQSGWLTRFGHGVVARSGEQVDWAGGVYALQSHLGLPIHVGARTALELKGLGHQLAMGNAPVWLMAPHQVSLPGWFVEHRWSRPVRFVRHESLPGFTTGDLSFSQHDFGAFTLRVSGPERAALEVCDLTPRQESFENADHLMEGLGALRPDIVQKLLEQCRSIKAKRLFLALADRQGHDWLARLDMKRVDMGTGKRSLFAGGKLNAKYQLVLPPELVLSETEAAR